MFYCKQKRGAFRGKYRLKIYGGTLEFFFQKLPLCFTTEQKQHVLHNINIIMVYETTIRLFCISQRKKDLKLKAMLRKQYLKL